jgi:site-specific DNA-methyltransferase (adenine-specific)
MMRCERFGDCTLYLGDNREIAPTLPRHAALIGDPPYGMKWDGKVTGGAGGHSAGSKSRNFGTTIRGDDVPFDPAPWLSLSSRVVLWGSNHYASRLPVGTTLIWLKRLDGGFGSFLSDAEMAWMNRGHGVYCKRDTSLMAETRYRAHPCQKPVPLLQWCIQQARVPVGGSILDPWMGSGSTGIAAAQLGHPFTGIEIEPHYFDTACRRIAAAAR